MKKILLFVCIAIITGSLSAQNYKFGVFIEPAATWLSPQSRTVQSDGSEFGFSGGLIIENYFQDNYAFSTGLGIGYQGGRLTFNENSFIHVYDETDSVPPGTTIQYHLNYLTIPLGLKLKTNQIGYFTYFVDLGFTAQFNISAKGTSDKELFSSKESYYLDNEPITKEINFANLGYHFGGGVEYGLSEDTSLLLGIYYHNGFTDVTERDAKVLSRVISFRVGIMF